MVAPNEETVEYNILLNAKEALVSLQEFNKAAQNSGDTLEGLQARANNLAKTIEAAASKAGISFEEMYTQVEKLNTSLGGTESLLTGGTLNQITGSLEQVAQAETQVGNSFTETATKAETSSKLMVGGVDIVRRAVSFLIGQLLFQFLATIQQVFTSAIDNVKKLETSFYNLQNAEKAMSENGIAVTFQDLEAVVDRLHTKFQGLFSANELQSVVAQIAIATKNLGLTTDQIEKIAQTAATIQLRNPDKSISEIAQTLTTSDLNGRLVSLAKLGVNTTAIKQKEDELAASLGTTTDKLTENQKAVIELEAAYASVNGETDNLVERQNTIAGSQQKLNATWDDFISKIGVIAAPILIKFFQALADELQKASVWIDNNKEALTALSDAIAAGIPTGVKLIEIFIKLAGALTGVGLVIYQTITGLQKLINLIPGVKQAVDAVSGKYESVNNTPADTPTTGGGSALGSNTSNSDLIKAEQKTEDELNKIFTENRDKRIDIDTAYAQKLQDIALSNQQKLEDIATKEAQNVADAYTNYNQKIADIETSSAQKVQDTKVEYQQKEKDLTKQHYDDLKKLRDKYLLDLEDALHNRDARQILKLMQQYQIDKKAANDSYKQQQQKLKQEEQLKLKQIELDKKRAEAQAKQDLERKLADIALAANRERQAQAINYARQQADARTAYQRQLQDQQVYLQRKLRDLATAIQQEYNLTAAGMAAINALISSYAGTGGSGIGTSSPTSFSASNYTAATGVSAVLPQSQYNINDVRFRSSLGLAEGGSFLATTPTKINVAENRPELITATPLGRPGQDVGKLFAQSGIGGKNSGQLEVALTLSPDLEARVVRKSLDETANIVTKINRSRV